MFNSFVGLIVNCGISDRYLQQMPEMCQQCSDRRAQLQYLEPLPATVFSFPYKLSQNLWWFSPKPSSKDTSLNAFLWVLYSQFADMSALLCWLQDCRGGGGERGRLQTRHSNKAKQWVVQIWARVHSLYFPLVRLCSGLGPSPYLVTTIKYLIYTQLFWACAALPRRRYCTLLSSSC